METTTRTDRYDFDALDQALAELAEATNEARVAFIMGDDVEGRTKFFKAISATAREHRLQLRTIVKIVDLFT